MVEWLRAQLCSSEKELFIVAAEEVEKNRSWSLDSGVTQQNNGRDMMVSLPAEQNSTATETANAMLAPYSNVDGTLDSNIQKRLLASVEGEDAFCKPGLKFIDHDAASVEGDNKTNLSNDNGSVKNDKNIINSR